MRKKAWEEEKKSLSLTDIQSQLPAMKKDAATWKKNFIDSYRKFYGVKLDIPRWQEIASQYEVK